MKTPYFPIYANDDLADASCLSLEEYGAYTRLRCHAWKDDPTGTLPDDDDALSRFAGVGVAKWQEMKPAVMRLFTRGADGRWHHSGLRQAFEKARQKSKSAQASAKQRWGNGSGRNAKGMRTHNDGNANGQPKQSMSEVKSQTLSSERDTRARGSSGRPQQEFVADSFAGPNDDFAGDLPPEREWTRGERFILKACQLWEKPILETDPKIKQVVRGFGKWIEERVDPNRQKGGRPEWFQEFWFQVLKRTIAPRPEYLIEQWDAYDRWLIDTYEPHRQGATA
jgi:uncharacterized protein YdaU (DUF1376 family)